MIVMNVFYAGARLSGRGGRRPRQPSDSVVPRPGPALIAADVVLAAADIAAGRASPAPRCGGCTWRSRKACCRNSWPTPRPQNCSARFRDFQSCQRRRAAAGECHCGRAVERFRRVGHVPGRGSLRCSGRTRFVRLPCETSSHSTPSERMRTCQPNHQQLVSWRKVSLWEKLGVCPQLP